MLFQEVGPIRPFAPAYGIYPTTTVNYRFQIDIHGNVLIRSQFVTHPHKHEPVEGDWRVELHMQDNIPIPAEMMDIIHSLFEEKETYFLSHWKFVIDLIRTIKEKAIEQYQDVYLKNKRLEEQVEVLTAQKEQLERRLNLRRG